MDINITTAKTVLDAEILAAQVKAKSAVSVYITTAKAALADIESWVAATPGELHVVESTVSKVLQDIKAFDSKVVTDAEAVIKVVETSLSDVSAGAKDTVGFFGKIGNWWKIL